MNSIKNWKHWTTNIITITIIGFLFSTSGCKCDDMSDPNCPNYDPCYCVNEPFGDFYMEESVMYVGVGRYIKTDTTLERNDVRFTVYDKDIDSVKWKIGLDPTYRTNNPQTIYFQDPYGAIEITAIVYKSKVKECFPKNDGIDTVTKTIHVLEWWKAPYFASFTGYHKSDPNHVFTMEIDTSTYAPVGWTVFIPLLRNFPDGFDMSIPKSDSNQYHPYAEVSYTGFILTSTYVYGNMRAYYSNNGKIEIDYYQNDVIQFVGTKN